MVAMFVNLPVTDLERAKAFYTAIGFTINFTDLTAARVVVEEGHSAFMILTRDFFQTFTDRPIGDPAVTVSVATPVFLDSREAVDGAVVAGIAAGGAKAPTRHGLRLHVSASAHRPRWQRPRVRLDGPGRRRAGSRGLRVPAGLRSMAARDYGSTAASRERRAGIVSRCDAPMAVIKREVQAC